MARESIIPVFVPHLGCPNDCVFCNQRRISGHTEPATAQTVREAVERADGLLPKDTARQLAFYGGSFTAIPVDTQTELLEEAKRCLDAGLISSLRLSTRPDAIDGEVLRRLRHYGVETVELGAQSMDDTVLRLSGRGHAAEDVENAARQIRVQGFRLILQMMTGLPGDSEERCIETARRLIALKPDGVRIYPTVIVRDTALYELWQRGRYREHTVDEAVAWCAKLLPMFDKAGIPVIRLGLNPTDELSGGAAVGGAYHPALGELVMSRILYDRARELLTGVPAESHVTLTVGRGKRSQMTGQHRRNLTALREEFSLASLTVRERGEPDNDIMIEVR